MADEIEIMKNERAAAPDGAEWMTGPPAGVQVDDFVCGLQRGGVKLWIDNDGLFLGHAGVVVCIDHHELCVIAHGVVNHLDGNKGNNAPGNLEVVTHQQNVRHAIDVLGVNRGERCGQAKLTEQAVREIRAMREAGATYAAIGERFGVSGNQASRVARRVDWGHVA